MSYYVIKNKYTIPSFLFRALASWVIALSMYTIIFLADWSLSATIHFELIKSITGPIRVLLNFLGAYTAFGALFLYVAMWVYWIAVQRSPIAARIGWFFALLLGLQYGALAYALVVWRKDMRKVDGPQPVPDVSALG